MSHRTLYLPVLLVMGLLAGILGGCAGQGTRSGAQTATSLFDTCNNDSPECVAASRARAAAPASATASAPEVSAPASGQAGQEYLVGPGDTLNVFVWRNPDLSAVIPVRPDGKISIPMVEDLRAIGKTPTQIARDIEHMLGAYIKEPMVTVIVTGFGGPYSQQVRIIGEAARPQALAFREKMSLLDAVIAVGGLTEFAAGNRASVIRSAGGTQQRIKARLDDLVKKGDITANFDLMPGDVIVIPESWF